MNKGRYWHASNSLHTTSYVNKQLSNYNNQEKHKCHADRAAAITRNNNTAKYLKNYQINCTKTWNGFKFHP